MERPGDPARLNGHVVICHANEMVKRIVEQLHGPAVAEPPDVLLLDTDADPWATHPGWRPSAPAAAGAVPATGRAPRCLTLRGDPASSDDLRRAGIAQARCAVVLADPRLGELADARSALIAMAIERENPQVHTIIELLSPVTRIHVRATRVNEIVCRGEVAERLIAQSCITPGVKNLFQQLLSTTPGECRVLLAPLRAALAGSTFRSLARQAVQREAPFLVCGYVRVMQDALGEPVRCAVLSPPAGTTFGKDTALGPDDELVLLARERPELSRWLGAPGSGGQLPS